MKANTHPSAGTPDLVTAELQGLMNQAVSLHQQGQLPEARALYQQVLSGQPNWPPAMHNLGMVLLGLGELAPAVELVETALLLAGNEAGTEQTAAIVGMTLYQHSFWEQAVPWLEKALAQTPEDSNIQSVLERIRSRDYLAPEVFDPLADEVLLRYSPREAANYVYTIDIVGTCNLRCPSCPVGNFSAADRSKGFMSYEMFEKIIDKVQRESPCKTPEIWLYNWGEPLMHPELPQFIKLLNQRGLSSNLSSNLNIEEGLQPLIKAGPSSLKISLSGYSQETYSVTHARGDFQLLKSNLYRLRHYMDKYKSTTHVWVGHHIYKNNQHEVEAVKAMCEELNFEYQPFQAYFQSLEKLLGVMQGKVSSTTDPVLDLLITHPEDYITAIKGRRIKEYDCELRFNQTVINYDGSVALCCGVYDKENSLGVQFLDEEHSALEARKYQHSFCQQCRNNGLDYSVSRLPEQL